MAESSPMTDRSEAVRLFEEGGRCLNAANTQAARARFEEALRADPSLAEARYNLALLCARGGDHGSALALLRECCRQRPLMSEAHAALGGLLLRMGQPTEALQPLKQAHALAPESPVAPNNLGLCLLALDRPSEAEAAFRAAHRAAPENPDIASNLGSALHAQERNQEAAELLSSVVQLYPGHDRARLNLAFSLLSDARYKEAWPHFEARTRLGLAGSGRRFPGHAWDGESPLRDRSILVHSEQGLGDTLQFSRFLPALAALGARVHLEVQAPLLSLFKELPCIECVHEAGRPTPACDFHCALPSLPLLLPGGGASLPAPNPGLRFDPVLSAYWAAQLPDKTRGLRIGLVWGGSPLHANDRHRSLPLQPFAETLRGLPCQFVSLQIGARQEDLSSLSEATGLHCLSSELRDFADSASLLPHLDLLISVDTAWAHLAGLFGHPLWLLVPKPSDWRWSPSLPAPGWYPSARLFRQAAPGDWSAPFAKLRQALQGAVSQG
jgi:Flp pilus assembly protein TadD